MKNRDKCTFVQYLGWLETEMVGNRMSGFASEDIAVLSGAAFVKKTTAEKNIAEQDVSPEAVSKKVVPEEIVRTLRHEIRHLETAPRQDNGQSHSTGCEVLDRWLPQGGLVPGTITEWLTSRDTLLPMASWSAVEGSSEQRPPVLGGYGAESLSLLAAREACARGGTLVVVDPDEQFYPPAAAAWGIALERTVVLRCRESKEMLWAVDQALRCPAVAVVWGWLDFGGERWWRRFQIAAEETGTMGMFLRSTRWLPYPSWAEVQWWVAPEMDGSGSRKQSKNRKQSAEPPPGWNQPNVPDGGANFSRWISIQLRRCRGGRAGPCAWVEVDFETGQLRVPQAYRNLEEFAQSHETNSLHLSSQLAHPAAGGCQ